MSLRSGVTSHESWWQEPCMAYTTTDNYYNHGLAQQQAQNHGQTYYNQNGGLYAQSDCYSSSHSGYNAVNSPRSKTESSEAPRNCGFIEFFGEEFAGMEETFRSALLQYFSQVDKERQDLADELEKIRTDFCQYQRETQEKIESKDNIIRQLNEKGRSLATQFDQLKDEFNDGELTRQQLISENNELQKQVMQENIVIPQLESELKTLTQENDYLKLLADDTKKLSQQENEIRQYANDLYKQKKICQQQSEKISKQAQAFQNLSKINDELCIKINQLAHLQNADRKLDETTKQYNALAGEFDSLQSKHSNLSNNFEELKQLVDSLETEKNDARKGEKEMKDQYDGLNVEFGKKCRELEIVSLKHQDKERTKSDTQEQIRRLEEDNNELRKDKEHLHREIKNLRGDLDELVYEDNARNEDFDELRDHNNVLRMRCEEFTSKVKELTRENEENAERFESLRLKEEGYKHKIKCMESHSTGCDDSVQRMQIKVDRLVEREKKLEDEILSYVKKETESEQKCTLMYHNLETLKRNNETCNQQRAQLQQEIRSLESKLREYERLDIERKTEVELRQEIDVIRKQYEESESRRLMLQDEIFTLERGGPSTNQYKNQLYQSTSSIIYGASQSNGVFNGTSQSNEIFNTNSMEVFNNGKQSIENEEFKIFAQKKDEEIELLIDQKHRYQEECRLLLEEVQCLKGNYESIENKLDEHNLYIDDLTAQCSTLQDQIATRNRLIHEQEENIEELKVELDQHQENGDSIILNQELSTKEGEINELKEHCKNLQQVCKSQQTELIDIKTRLVSSEGCEETQNELLEEFNFLQQRLEQLEEENFELQQQRSTNNKAVTSSIDPELNDSLGSQPITGSLQPLSRQSEELKYRIRELEDQIEGYQGQIRQLQGNQQQHQQSIDYSFENDQVINKEKYLDLLDCMRNKELIITDLQEHINLLEQENYKFNSQGRIDSSVKNEMELSPVKVLSLRLPSPDLAAARKEPFSFKQKRSSLPPLPSKSNGDQSVNAKEKRARDSVGESEIRGKVIKLNAELLEKKMLITKYEEELKILKRRYDRLQETHKSTIDKNETIENEIIENRKRITDVQTKQSKTNAENESQYRKEIQTYRESSEKLQDQCKSLRREKDDLLERLSEQKSECRMLESNFEQSERQLSQWDKNNKVLEEECSRGASKCEKLQEEIVSYRDQIYELNRENDILRRDNETMRLNCETRLQKIEELNEIIDRLKREINDRVKSNEEAFDQIRAIEQDRNMLENKVNNQSITIEKLNDKCRSQHEEINRLNSKLKDWRLRIENESMENKELLAVKEINDQNTKYLESKLEESRSQLKENHEANIHLKDTNESLQNEIRKLNEELRYANIDVDNIKEQYTNENKNVENLEKLNKDINRENKKLMIEVVELKQKFGASTEESQCYKQVIVKVENEQKTLEKMLANTQQSNSELLNNNKTIKDELRVANTRIIELQEELEGGEKDRVVAENKLLSLEKEFEHATRDLHEENKELRGDLEKSQLMISEFEAILDQGQLDFDELDGQLERYRVENVELDQRLHDALKLQIRLQSEREELDRKVEVVMEDMTLMKENLDNERKFSHNWNKEKETLEILVDEFKSKEERYEQQITNLREESNTKLDLLEDKDLKIEKLEANIEILTTELGEVKQKLETSRRLSDAELKESCVDCGHANEGLEESCIDCGGNASTAALKESCVDCGVQDEEISALRKRADDLKRQLKEKEEQVDECVEIMRKMEGQKELADDHKTDLLIQMESIERELEDEKINHEKDVEDCLREISELRDHITDQEVANEKMAFDNRKYGHEMKEVIERNEYLEERLENILNETDLERNAMIETIAMLEEKVNNFEDDEVDELQHLRSAVRQLEGLRDQEEKDFEKALEASQKLIHSKDIEIQDLRADVIQLKTSLDEHENKNTELTKSMTSLENQEKMSKAKLLQDLREQEQSFMMLQERSSMDGEQKNSLKVDVERLTREVEDYREENKTMLQEHSKEKQQMQLRIEELLKHQYQCESLQQENENLKSDIEYFLSDRKDYQGRYQEISQLRAEIANLRFKQRRMEEVNGENQKLKQEVKNLAPDVMDQSKNDFQLVSENRKLKLDIEKLRYESPNTELLKENEKLKIQLEAAKQNMSEVSGNQLVSENQRLKDRISTLESVSGGYPSVNELMDENQALKDELKQRKALEMRQESGNQHLVVENQRLVKELEDAKRHQDTPRVPGGGSDSGYQHLMKENQRLTRELNELKRSQDIQQGSKQQHLVRENQRLTRELEEARRHQDTPRAAGADKNYQNLIQENQRLTRELENAKRYQDTPRLAGGDSNQQHLVKENQKLKRDLENIKQQLESKSPYESQILNTLTRENQILKNDVQALEMLRSENLRLKSDLDTVNQRHPSMMMGRQNSGDNQELERLRRENQTKNQRVSELSNENKMLKQELREIESKHITENEKLRTENKTLRKQVDDLFKKNQDLELSNISPVPTNVQRNGSLSFKQKAASFDNLAQASWNASSLKSSLSQSASVERLSPANQQKRQQPLSQSNSFERLSPNPTNQKPKQQPLSQSNSFDRPPLVNIQQHQQPLSQSNSFERLSQNLTNQKPKQQPLSQSKSFDRPPLVNIQQRQQTLNQSGIFDRFTKTTEKLQQQNSLSQSNSFERPSSSNQQQPQQTNNQWQSFDHLLPTNQNTRNTSPSPRLDSSFSSQTGTLKPMKVRFASQQDNKDIQTSPQIKSILNPFNGTPEPTNQNNWKSFPPQSSQDPWEKNTPRQPSKSPKKSPSSNVLNERPDVSQFSLIAFDDEEIVREKPKIDIPSGTSSLDVPSSRSGVKRTPSIKDNPFFEMDRSNSQSKSDRIQRSQSANSSPTKSSYQETRLPKDMLKFDMRPQSTEPTVVPRRGLDTTDDKEREKEIGNAFVKRLKGIFESSGR